MISPGLIAKRFEEAPDSFDALKNNKWFDKVFYRIVAIELERLRKLISCHTITQCDGDPYDCFDKLHADVLVHGRLRMKDFSKYPLPVRPSSYHHMRVIHDLHHVLLNIPFSYEGEFLAYQIMRQALERIKAPTYVLNYIRNDIVYSNACVLSGVDPGNKVVLEDLLYE